MLSYLLAYIYSAIMSQLAASPSRRTIIIGTRDSKLALAQTEIVRAYLAEQFPELEIKVQEIKTAGDKNLIDALYNMEGKALWTAELEDLLLDNKVDIIVHSLKGIFFLPTQFLPVLTPPRHAHHAPGALRPRRHSPT